MRLQSLLVLALAVFALHTTSRPAAADDAFVLRVATFNTSLSQNEAGEMLRQLETGQWKQAQMVAEILRRIRADVVLMNEFDYDAEQRGADLFRTKYLESTSGPTSPIRYPHIYAAPVNTGEPSGLDLDNDGKTDGPGDAFGFGRHPGHYGMLVLSRFPINTKRVRTFQRFLWKDLPQATKPTLDDKPFYEPATFNQLRLSSKSLWDVPIRVGGEQSLHLIASHPTPPVFDGPEDRNGARNRDEIRLLADYVTPGKAGYLYDDADWLGGLHSKLGGEPRFVIVGDLNADPEDGDSRDRPMDLLLKSPTVQPIEPRSRGAVEAAKTTGGRNPMHRGNPALDTGAFNPDVVGNLRIDYVLPSRNMQVIDSGVYWPPSDSPQAKLLEASDHRAVWVDVVWKP